MENKLQPAGEHLDILETRKILNVKCSNLNDSVFKQFCMDNSTLTDLSAQKVKISDANLSDLEIEFAQLGGAYIHDIGVPPEGHPNYDPNLKQPPLRFENCNLAGTTITDCNLSGVSITDCNLNGMKINGILVEDLLSAYKA